MAEAHRRRFRARRVGGGKLLHPLRHRPPGALQGQPVDSHEPHVVDFRRVPELIFAPRGAPHSLEVLPIRNGALQRSSQILHASRLEQGPRLPLPHDFRYRTDAGTHHRPAGGERLHNDPGERLVAPGWHHHEHGPAHLLADSVGRDRPHEHPGSEPQLQRRSFQVRPLRTIADDPETSLGSQQRYGMEQIAHPLLLRQTSHVHDTSVPMNRLRRARIWSEIRLHHQPVPRQASLDELASSELGHRDQQVDVSSSNTDPTLKRREGCHHGCQRVRSTVTTMPDPRPGKRPPDTQLTGAPGSLEDRLRAYETIIMECLYDGYVSVATDAPGGWREERERVVEMGEMRPPGLEGPPQRRAGRPAQEGPALSAPDVTVIARERNHLRTVRLQEAPLRFQTQILSASQSVVAVRQQDFHHASLHPLLSAYAPGASLTVSTTRPHASTNRAATR